MTASSDFDALYAATWRPLLLQTFALCGDLGTAREAVAHAFVEAWHHWSRASRREPEAHIRAAAFARAQWRSRARAFQRAPRVSKPQRVALRRLHEVPVQARKAVILACFTDLPIGAIGQQIGETEAHAEKLLEAGLAQLRTSLNLPDDQVMVRLRSWRRPPARRRSRYPRTCGPQVTVAAGCSSRRAASPRSC